MNNTTENIELKGYLLRQISSMKNPHSKLRPVIRYDTLYEYLRLEAPTSGALKKKKKGNCSVSRTGLTKNHLEISSECF